MADQKAKWVKIGKVIRKKAGGVCVVVGEPDNKNEQYKYSVEVTVKDSSGKKVANFTNGFLTVTDPRKRPGITEEQASKIPASLVSELFFVENQD